MAPKDRFDLLYHSPTLNGIDFVEIEEAKPLDIVVHFINANALSAGLTAAIAGGDSVPVVGLAPIAPGDWRTDAEGHQVLVLHALNAGDFSNYTLTLNDPRLDRFFTATTFSFKVYCPSDFDCAPPPHQCPPDDPPPPIDYLAKDFNSFRRALSDYAAQRYPGWQERSEADFGVMFMEALSALGDDLSYQQDRIAAEATLDTATELRSLARHARLVDYDARPATSARTILICKVATTALPAGVEVRASDPAGGIVPFETGKGLGDATVYAVDPQWNDALKPYFWDDSERCLKRGATQMWLQDIGHKLRNGQALLIETDAATSADPPLRQIVHLNADPEETTDPLYAIAVTRIQWDGADALTQDRDLTNDRTRLWANLVPATQGRRRSESFAIGTPPSFAPLTPLAVERLGANAMPASPVWDYRYPLADGPLAWLAGDDPDAAPLPEIALTLSGAPWDFRPRLLKAAIDEKIFSIEPARYRRIATLPDNTAQRDYDGDGGETLVFGTGDFGAAPIIGDVYAVSYRVGLGAQGNVAADAIDTVDPEWLGLLTGVSNPFPAAGGAARETNDQIRRRAPQAFRARQFRAVRAEDYQAEAERLAFVQQAGTTFRYTGSWFTVFTAIDPKGGETLPQSQQTQVVELLNRRRLAGYESYVPPPRYLSIDLDIEVCAAADAFRGDVERDVLDALAPPSRPSAGFFFADHFTFGTPLERSRIEAAIQNVPGVAGVEAIRYRLRAVVPDFTDLPRTLPIAVDQILRLDNDPSRPERGSLKLTVCGGR